MNKNKGIPKLSLFIVKILVTGGLGFIGSYIVDLLVEKGHDVRVLDNLEYQVHQGKYPAYARDDVEYTIGNVLDKEILKIALKDVEMIFHEAAAVGMGQSMYQIYSYTNSNVSGTAQLLDTIINGNFPVKKIMVAASMSSYGEGLYICDKCGTVSPPIRSKEQMDNKEWDLKCPLCGLEVKPIPTPESKSLDSLAIYSLNKKYQEEMCMSIGKTYGIPVVGLRYFNVYGPRQSLSNPYTGVAAIFMSRIKNNNQPYVYEDGEQTRDFIHVEDIARINHFVMESSNANYQIFNAGTQSPVSIKNLAEMLIKKIGATVSPVIANQGRVGDVRHCYADISKLKSLGFQHKYPEINLEALINWSKGVKAVDKFDHAKKEFEDKIQR